MVLIFAQKGNAEHLMQRLRSRKVLGFITVWLTALVLVFGNFGRIDAVNANTKCTIRESPLLERRGSPTDPCVGWNVTDPDSVAVNDALAVSINRFLSFKIGFRDVVDRLKLRDGT
jgi:hypothetical protein